MNKYIWVLLSLVTGATNAQVVHWLSQPEQVLEHINNGDVLGPKLSANGQYLSFLARASNLIENDHNHLVDLYVVNLQTQAVTLASVTAAGVQSHDYSPSAYTAPTSNGRYVAFSSFSEVFPFSLGFGHRSVYIKDLQTGAVENHSDYGSGLYFEATGDFHLNDSASTLVFATYHQIDPLHTNDRQVYGKNLSTDSFELISISHDGLSAADDSVDLIDVSDNGRYVLMASRADNLTTDVLNNSGDNLFLRDLVTDVTVLVNHTPSGASSTAGGYFSRASVSNNGEVVFVSAATDLVAADNNGRADVFYHDGSQIQRLNLDPSGQELADTNPTSWTAISGDGSRLAFFDNSEDLLNLNTNGMYQLYVYETANQQITMVSETNTGQSAAHFTEAPSFSSNGQRLAFASYAPDLLDTPHPALYRNVYVHDFNLNQRVAPVQGQVPVHSTNEAVAFPKMSSDQRFVAYMSKATNLVPQTIDDETGDLFLLDRLDNSHQMIARNGWGRIDVSPSGRYIVFRSDYFQPGGMIDLGAAYLFLHDRLNGDFVQLAQSYNFAVNDEGLVVFETEEGLAANDNNDADDVYLYDAQTGLFALISEGMGGQAVGGAQPDIGGLGNDVWIAFHSFSDDLVNADNNGLTDVFVKQWPSGFTIRASQTAAGLEGNGFSSYAKVSSNGEFVSFVTEADNLTGHDYSQAGQQQVLRFERATLDLRLVSVNEFHSPLMATSPQIYEVSISDSGRYTSYSFNGDSFNPDFSDDDDDYRKDVVLYDADTFLASIISTMPNGNNIASESNWNQVVEDLSLSPPRLGVVFQSGHELTEVDNHPGYEGIFLYQDGGPPFNLSITVQGPGAVSGSGAINCTSQCDFPRTLGSELSLVATPDIDAVFVGWQLDFGDCQNTTNPCLITMDRDKNLVAVFVDAADLIFFSDFD